MKIQRTIQTFVLPDLHCPFHDENAVELTIKIMRYKKPARVVLLGDCVDFYALSTFDKDPSRIKGIIGEVDEFKKILRKIRKAVPDGEIYFVEGNHEARLRKYIWRNAPALHDAISLDELMGFNEFGVKNMGKQFFLGGLLYTHGDVISAYSSYTAKREYDKYGCSGLSGHSHRLGKYVRRLKRGIESWHETGCLCDLEPDYVDFPNWQHGFGIVTNFLDRDSFHVDLIEIIPGYKAIVGDNIYF